MLIISSYSSLSLVDPWYPVTSRFLADQIEVFIIIRDCLFSGRPLSTFFYFENPFLRARRTLGAGARCNQPFGTPDARSYGHVCMPGDLPRCDGSGRPLTLCVQSLSGRPLVSKREVFAAPSAAISAWCFCKVTRFERSAARDVLAGSAASTTQLKSPHKRPLRRQYTGQNERISSSWEAMTVIRLRL